ncbi:MAG: hypothetical protein ACI9SQ_001686 [Rubritalea sp.]|jgi:hypothetical protein
MMNSAAQKKIFWGTFALGLAWALYRLFASTGYILDDEATHYIKSKSAWANPDIFFDLWTRAGRNLIHAFVAPLGLTATRLFTLFMAAVAVILTAKSAKHIGLKSIWAIPVLMFFQSWFPDLSYSILTQTPFMIIWILGIYLAQKDRFYLASICFGYLSLIRHEGILLTALWGIWISCQSGGILNRMFKKEFNQIAPKAITRDTVLAFFTVLPIIIFNLADYLYFKGGAEYSFPFEVYFESNPTDYYGSGSIYHYAVLLVPALGIFSLLLALFGALFIKKDLQKWSLILFTYVSYFVVHSYIFWTGTFASGGYYHFLMPMAPLFALLGVKAFDVILEKCEQRGKTIVIAAVFLVVIQGIHMLQQQGMYQWQSVLSFQAPYKASLINPPIQPELRGINIREASEYVSTIRKDALVTGNHPHVDIHFSNLHDKAALERDWGDIRNFSPGTYFIWDQRLSELRETHRLEKFQTGDWEIIKVWENSKRSEEEPDPNNEYTTIIFKKVR